MMDRGDNGYEDARLSNHVLDTTSRIPSSWPSFRIPRSDNTGGDYSSPTTPTFDFSSDLPAKDRTGQEFRYSNTIPGENEDLSFSRNDTEISSNFASTKRYPQYYRQRSALTNFLRDWWLELIAFFFLFGALIAIVIAAHEYEDHPLPNLPRGLTLNSIFSIFVVVLKAAMLLILAQGLSHLKWTWFNNTHPLNDLATYDWASRGPLGSIWLLFRLKGRDLLATLGALLIIAHVVLDPMAQQIIRYYSCNQVQPNSSASVPRTNAYMEIGRHIGAGLSTISNELQSAVNGGVFNPGSQVSYSCPSGNCTFPDVTHTVGMQSVCTDISSELTFQNTTGSNGATYLNSTLPSGLYTSYNRIDQRASLMTMHFNSTLNNSVEIILSPQFPDPLTQRDLCTGPLDENITNRSSNWICRGWGAARCTITPVVYEIQNISIQSGQLTQQMQFASSLDYRHAGFSTGSFGVADVSCLTTAQKVALRQQGYSIPDSLRWLAYNVTLDLGGNFTSTPAGTPNDIVPKRCIYQIYGTTINSLDLFFGTYFEGTITPQYTDPTVVRQFYDDRGITFASVDSMFRNISNSMTVHIREHGLSNNSVPATGQVWEAESCVHIRWAYVAFPVVLTALTLVFFVVMIVVTGKSQKGLHHDFKSSPLALLFHGLDESAIQRVERMNKGGVDTNEIENLTEEAKGMMVRLRPTSRGWRFVVDEDQKTRVS